MRQINFLSEFEKKINNSKQLFNWSNNQFIIEQQLSEFLKKSTLIPIVENLEKENNFGTKMKCMKFRFNLAPIIIK